MALNTVLVTLAGISLAADLAVVTSPSLDSRLGVPKLESALLVPTSQKDSKVSVQFHSARVSEVLNWLQSHGFNFVVNDGDIQRSKTVTINVTNQSVGSVADAIANALGGHWDTANGIHIYKTGTTSMNWMKVPSEGAFIFSDSIPGMSPGQKLDVEKLQGQFGPDFQKKIQDQFGPEFQKKMQEQFGPDFQKKIQDQFGPEFQKKMQEQFGPDFQKKMAEQFGPDFQKKIQDQFGPEFQKKMQAESGKDLDKKFKDQFGPEFEKRIEEQFGPKFQKQMEDQFGPEFQKKIEDQFGPKFQKQMEDQFGPEFQKKIEEQFGPKFQKQMEDMSAQLQKELEKNKALQGNSSDSFSNRSKLFIQSDSKSNHKNKGDNTLASDRFDATRFLNSLTSDEKDQQRKQGYIWYLDLTREQKMMFSQFDGKFDIDLKINGEEVRVRRN